MSVQKVAILTGGGDCPGLNAVIRAVVRTAIVDYGWEVVGIEDGFEGLIEGRTRELTYFDVAGIITEGGTILGTSNVVNPFSFPKRKGKAVKYEDASKKAFDVMHKARCDALICVGGEGTMSFAKRFASQGLPIVGIPKTIDNDVPGTERTVGFYSAVATATEAIDKLHTTAASHHRVMVVELMGRYAGWLTLASGISGAGDIILIPEIPFDLKKVFQVVKNRSNQGRRFTVVVVGEGATGLGGRHHVRGYAKDPTRPERLGGISQWLASRIEEATGEEARTVMLGHLLRSGGPVFQDRILATCFGYEAVHRLACGKKGIMIAWGKGEFFSQDLTKLPEGPRLVPEGHPWIKICEAMGASFGE